MACCPLRATHGDTADDTMNPIPDSILAAREQWRWTGQQRPPFADLPAPGQVSVWDYPRPPVIEPEPRELVIRWGDREIARTRRAVRTLETAHPPSFYIPWADVARELMHPIAGTSLCEWKGPARYWSLVDGTRQLRGVAWSYPTPMPGAESVADCVAFYPRDLDCFVDGVRVLPQPGGFYGGWITPELTGPFKGDVGSEGW